MDRPVVEEERRLFYVSLTRARERLHISYLITDQWRPSRFVDSIPHHTYRSGDGRAAPAVPVAAGNEHHPGPLPAFTRSDSISHYSHGTGVSGAVPAVPAGSAAIGNEHFSAPAPAFTRSDSISSHTLRTGESRAGPAVPMVSVAARNERFSGFTRSDSTSSYTHGTGNCPTAPAVPTGFAAVGSERFSVPAPAFTGSAVERIPFVDQVLADPLRQGCRPFDRKASDAPASIGTRCAFTGYWDTHFDF